MSLFQNPKKRAARRGWPIMGYVGSNGGGKSAAMVWDTLPSLVAGRPVLSTVRLLDWTNPRDCEGCEDSGHLRPVYGPVAQGEPEEPAERDRLGFPARELLGHVVHKAAHPLWVPFTDWEQLLEARGCDVLMDEVTGVASSRESQAMPSPVANKLVQLRRADVVVRWSAPSWARADKIIRECSQAVTYCRGFMPKATPGQGDRQWRQRRMFGWRTYDAADFEDFTAGKREQLDTLTVDWHWGPRSPVFAAYDTFDAVSAIGTVTDTGRCYRCGGRREIPRCRCGSPSDGSASSAGEAGGKAGGRPGRTRAPQAPRRAPHDATERPTPLPVSMIPRRQRASAPPAEPVETT